jgi:hypothetical protein
VLRRAVLRRAVLRRAVLHAAYASFDALTKGGAQAHPTAFHLQPLLQATSWHRAGQPRACCTRCACLRCAVLCYAVPLPAVTAAATRLLLGHADLWGDKRNSFCRECDSGLEGTASHAAEPAVYFACWVGCNSSSRGSSACIWLHKAHA